VVDAAIAAGITFIDMADAYGNRGGSERLLGETLGSRRKDVVLATKFGLPMDEAGRLKGASRAYVMTAVEESLKRLKTEWIDLYYLHRPDPATPIEETLRALEDLVRQGKVRFTGCSNLSGPQLADSIEVARAQELEPFAAAQDEYNLLSRGIESDLLPVIERHGMALVPYFPLASGLLTGKYRKGQPMPPGTRRPNSAFPRGSWEKRTSQSSSSSRYSAPSGAAPCCNSPLAGCCRGAVLPALSPARPRRSRCSRMQKHSDGK